MDSYDIKRFALIQATIAEIEGMKIKNKERKNDGMAFAYSQDHFDEKSDELRELASKHNEQL